jgi:hypothetical protein
MILETLPHLTLATRPMSQSISRHTIDLIAAALLGFVISSSAHELWSWFRIFQRDVDQHTRPVSNEDIVDGVTGLIGTLACEILAASLTPIYYAQGIHLW